jgi:hypothetical protein
MVAWEADFKAPQATTNERFNPARAHIMLKLV